MPDIAVHHAFGQEVKASLSPEIQNYLVDSPYIYGLYGPDPWFMYQPWKRRQGRGRRMHTTRTGAFLKALALRSRSGASRRETFSYLAGFLCHYALDSAAHPYIIWQTTETWPTRRAHRDMEHALDVSLLKREGYWGEKHPVTAHHFPGIRLPGSMASDLNAVYLEVYGWHNAFPSLHRCYAMYRWLYRQLEKPRSPLTLLASLIPSHRFRSLPYARSAFLDRDVENLSHQPWHEAYAREMTSTESFPDLYEKAREEAVRMISDVFSFSEKGSLSVEELEQSLGNHSYFSGLDVADPRNLQVRSLRPFDEGE